jgi:hypothetical protein
MSCAVYLAKTPLMIPNVHDLGSARRKGKSYKKGEKDEEASPPLGEQDIRQFQSFLATSTHRNVIGHSSKRRPNKIHSCAANFLSGLTWDERQGSYIVHDAEKTLLLFGFALFERKMHALSRW